MFTRREFLNRAAAAASTAAFVPMASRLAWADDLPKDVRITRVVAFDLPLKRAKIAGKNSRLDVHGDTSRDAMVRLFTNAGVEGIGACRVDEKTARALLGKNPLDFFRREKHHMSGPLGNGTMPLWDLAGKLLEQPAYKLLGGAGSERVPVYDGSIYFADLLSQYSDRWQDRFREEIDQGRERGHTAFKIKIGRGAKWMPREAGDARDLAVIETIRQHAGADVLLGVDANNGYDLAGAKTLIDRTADANIAFVEELFDERVDACLELKKHIAAKKLKTLLADGETQGTLEPFEPLIKAGAIDVLQGDMKHFGFEGILDEAEMAAAKGVLVAPHNWGSLIGFYMQLHVGRAIKNFYRAEHDPLSTDVLLAEGYKIDGGEATVSDAAGFGLAIDEKKFAELKVSVDVRA
ncbi:MAG: mandelate racemase/muconate lactonizing enzyme family protein [Pirellulales bacterium]